jgi:cobalt-zinc-cadmium efflux system outer membrane protein
LQSHLDHALANRVYTWVQYRAAYKEGGLDLARLLDAERVRVEAEVSRVEALEGYHQSVVLLDYAEGAQP